MSVDIWSSRDGKSEVKIYGRQIQKVGEYVILCIEQGTRHLMLSRIFTAFHIASPMAPDKENRKTIKFVTIAISAGCIVGNS